MPSDDALPSDAGGGKDARVSGSLAGVRKMKPEPIDPELQVSEERTSFGREMETNLPPPSELLLYSSATK